MENIDKYRGMFEESGDEYDKEDEIIEALMAGYKKAIENRNKENGSDIHLDTTI